MQLFCIQRSEEMKNAKTLMPLVVALVAVSATSVNAEEKITSAEPRTPAASKNEIQRRNEIKDKRGAVQVGEVNDIKKPAPIGEGDQAVRIDEKQYRNARPDSKP
jgi:hypothetical protein